MYSPYIKGMHIEGSVCLVTKLMTRGGPNVTKDRISKLLLIAYSCDKAQLQL